jgi:hypothetical protein
MLLSQQQCSQDPRLGNAGLNSVTCNALDAAFRDFAASCKLPYPLILTKNSDLTKTSGAKTQLVSAVPDLLLRAVERAKMQTPYLVTQNIALARLLSQVLSSKAITSLQLSDYIGATAGAQAATLSQMFIDASGYSTTCQSTIAANVNVSAGFTFLPATLQSSLNSSINASSKSGLLFSVGAFDSPLWLYKNNSSEALYPDLLLLAWRVSHSKQDANLYYLAHARGVTSAQLSSSQFDSDTNLNGTLSAGFFSVSTKDTIQLAHSVTSQLSSSFYNTVVESPVDADFDIIPSLADLQNAIGKFQLAPPSPSTTNLTQQGATSQISQQIPGVPQDMCSGLNTIWSVADADPAAKWNVVPGSVTETVGTSDANGVPSCTFAFNLQTTADVPGSFTAKPVITGKFGGSTFTLSLQPVAFTASLFPQFGSKVLYNEVGTPKTLDGAKVLEYQVPISILQSASVTGYNAVSWEQNKITATCTNGFVMTLVPPSFGSMPISPTGNSQALATLEFAANDARGPIDTADPNPLECTIGSGRLQFTNSAASQPPPIDRELSANLGLNIQLPHVKPPLTINIVSNTNGSVVFAGTIQGVSDPAVLTKTVASINEGKSVLATGVINADFSVTFPAVTLAPTIAHNVTFSLSLSPTISGAVSDAVTIPAPAPQPQPK